MTDTIKPPGSVDYFSRREAQERRLAEQARDCSARRAHLAMADRYAALAKEQTATILIHPAAA